MIAFAVTEDQVIYPNLRCSRSPLVFILFGLLPECFNGTRKIPCQIVVFFVTPSFETSSPYILYTLITTITIKVLDI